MRVRTASVIDASIASFQSSRRSLANSRAIEDLQASDGQIIAAVRISGQGAASGVPVAHTFWQIARFRQGRLVWIRFYGTRQEALQAAGLRE
jgi:hypothetical protein